jgi:hypothetical protein
MRRGVDPNGKPLAPVAKWTRVVGLGAGASRNNSIMIPLHNTGRLRQSMGVQEITKQKLVFGFAGKMLDIAERMYFGLPGMMTVKAEAIKGSKLLTRYRGSKIKRKTAYRLGYSGIMTRRGTNKQYIRIEVRPQKWLTKKVVNGQIRVNPRARPFFFLSNKQIDAIQKDAEKWVNERGN